MCPCSLPLSTARIARCTMSAPVSVRDIDSANEHKFDCGMLVLMRDASNPPMDGQGGNAISCVPLYVCWSRFAPSRTLAVRAYLPVSRRSRTIRHSPIPVPRYLDSDLNVLHCPSMITRDATLISMNVDSQVIARMSCRAARFDGAHASSADRSRESHRASPPSGWRARKFCAAAVRSLSASGSANGSDGLSSKDSRSAPERHILCTLRDLAKYEDWSMRHNCTLRIAPLCNQFGMLLFLRACELMPEQGP